MNDEDLIHGRFGPSGNPALNEVNQYYENLLARVYAWRSSGGDDERNRQFAIAIDLIQCSRALVLDLVAQPLTPHSKD